LVGSGVALAISALFPNDPRRMVERAAQPIFELIVMLGETTAALHTGDLKLAEQALEEARGIDALVGGLKLALAAGYGIAQLSPPRRRDLGYLAHYAAACGPAGSCGAERARVLARAAVNLLQNDKHVPEQLSEALLDLARAVETLDAYLQRFDHLDTRHFALKAAEEASAVLKERNDLETNMLVGDIQSTAMDLLHASAWTTPNRGRRSGRWRATPWRSRHPPTKTLVGYNPQDRP
jgi:hypothetical protein